MPISDSSASGLSGGVTQTSGAYPARYKSAAPSARWGMLPLRTTMASAATSGSSRTSHRPAPRNAVTPTASARMARRMMSRRVVTKRLRSMAGELRTGRSIPGALKPGLAHQKTTKSQEDQTGLSQADAPQNLPGFIAGILAERLFRGVVQQVYEAAVVSLLEIMKRAPEQQMQIELAAQGSQFPARSAVQDRVCNSNRSAKPGDDAAHGGHLYLACCVADQIDETLADLALHRNPP